MPIDRFNEVSGLLEKYWEEYGGNDQWVTVQEFRDYFHMTGESGHIIAAFFCGLMNKPISGFPFIVHRVERLMAQYRYQITPQRYLVKRR